MEEVLIPILLAAAVMLSLALLFTITLNIAKVRLHVEVDPRIERISEILPGANCGGCGAAGCSSFARAVVEGKSQPDGCPVGGANIAALVAEIMGIKIVANHPVRPIVRCQAKKSDRLGRAFYQSVGTCTEANVVGGMQACTYGCLGFADCLVACRYDAITMVDDLPVIDYQKCTNCGACSRACPREIIDRAPFSSDSMYAVACSNRDPGRAMKTICKVGCIACGACSKAVPELFEVKDNLAEVNYNSYDQIDPASAAQKCPTKVIMAFGTKKQQQQSPVSSSLC